MFYTDTKLDRILGPLPDAFEKRNGERMTDRGEWKEQRKYLLEKTVPLLFGGMPPEPEHFSCYYMYGDAYMITAGTDEKTISFDMQLYRPEVKGKCPVLICGDQFYCNDAVIAEAKRRGFAVARFNRCILASDIYHPDHSFGLYTVYPDGKFSAIAAWAWGYLRCVDALEKMDFIDTDYIAIAGQSRGGKTTLLAGAVDERIKFIQSSCSGAAGSGCFRYEQQISEEAAEKHGIHDKKSEKLEDLLRAVPYWLGNDGEDIREYAGREEELPFDMHFLKAAVAPRYLLETLSLDDVWANPRGAHYSYLAAKEVFSFLGVRDNLVQSCRYGPHGHTYNDFCRFFDFIECTRDGKPYLWDNSDKLFDGIEWKK